MSDLKPDQQEVADAMIKFYKAVGELFFVLTGWAGVGKTYTIQRVIKNLQKSHPNIKVCLTAPTHKAVKVLNTMAEDYGINVECRTIYSLLGMVLDSNGEIKMAKKMSQGGFGDMDLVVVDEGSMLNKNVVTHLREAAILDRVKVIVMGDKYQIPPVKEVKSQAFEQADQMFHLTENRRQVTGNPILELTESLRNDIIEGKSTTKFVNKINSKLDQGIYVLGAVDWYNCVKENFLSDEYRDDPDSFRCLAWTNKRVDSLNKSLRRLLVGETKTPFIQGERVLTRSALVGDITDPKPEIVAHTDEELKVLSITKALHPLYSGMTIQFTVWEVLLLSERGVSTCAYILHEDSARDYKAMLEKLGAAAKVEGRKWSDFWNFKDSFANLQSPHAMTIHRSQGSSYGNVFLDVDDVFKNPRMKERNQLLYVGVSRARESALLLRR
jgi:exodeoxyribonuclease-5